MPIVNRIADLHGEITAWRRDIHAHPELLYDVHRTAASVAEKLKSFGCDEVVTGIGRTGVVGVIRGGKGAGSRVIGLRADMDALPIEEANDVPYKSTVPGKMHACGHDGHTAMLLGAARYLAETRNFAGTAVVIFQPAEEGGAGGKAMVQDGLMDRFRIEEVYGMHNYPGLAGRRVRDPAGAADGGGRPHHDRDRRPRRACRAAAYLDRYGAGGRPDHQPDPVDRRAQRRSAARGGDLDLRVPGGHRPTTSSRRPRCCAAPRAASRPQVRDLLERRLHEVVEGTAQLYGATAKLTYKRDYPVTRNHERQAAFAAVGRGAGGRQRAGRRRRGAGDGRGGLLVHAGSAPGRLHLRRQRRQRRPAPSGLRLQRRGDPDRHLVLGEAGGNGAAELSRHADERSERRIPQAV